MLHLVPVAWFIRIGSRGGLENSALRRCGPGTSRIFARFWNSDAWFRVAGGWRNLPDTDMCMIQLTAFNLSVYLPTRPPLLLFLVIAIVTPSPTKWSWDVLSLQQHAVCPNRGSSTSKSACGCANSTLRLATPGRDGGIEITQSSTEGLFWHCGVTAHNADP